MTPHDEMGARTNADSGTTDSRAGATDTPREGSASGDAKAVHDAIDAGDLRLAYQLVIDDRWAVALRGESKAEVSDATLRVACAAILDDPPTFASLRKRYPDIGDGQSEILARLQPVSADWASARGREELPPALSNFATQISVARGPAALRLARDLSGWYWSDPDAALSLFRRIDQASAEIGPFLLSVLEPLAAQVEHAGGELPLPAQPEPGAVLRRFVLVNALLAGAVTAGLAGAFFAFDWVNRKAIGTTFAVLLVTLYAGQDRFDKKHDLQRKFVDACLGANLEPKLAAGAIYANPLLRASIVRSKPLALAFHIGRLARLDSGAELANPEG